LYRVIVLGCSWSRDVIVLSGRRISMGATDAAVEADNLFYLNGVDAVSGSYLTPPVMAEELVELAIEEYNRTSRYDREVVHALSDRLSTPHLGFNANLEDPAEARWGIIFASGEDEAVR